MKFTDNQGMVVNMNVSHTSIFHGPHIFGLTNFPDFSSIFFPFSSIFSVFYLKNFTNTKIYWTKALQVKIQKKFINKNRSMGTSAHLANGN